MPENIEKLEDVFSEILFYFIFVSKYTIDNKEAAYYDLGRKIKRTKYAKAV